MNHDELQKLVRDAMNDAYDQGIEDAKAATKDALPTIIDRAMSEERRLCAEMIERFAGTLVDGSPPLRDLLVSLASAVRNRTNDPTTNDPTTNN